MHDWCADSKKIVEKRKEKWEKTQENFQPLSSKVFHGDGDGKNQAQLPRKTLRSSYANQFNRQFIILVLRILQFE